MKKTAFSISGALGVHRLSASLHRHQPIVLTFHGVTADPPGHLCNREGLHLHRPIFARLMAHVAARYRPVPLMQVVEWLEGGRPVPERAVVVTFDDGFRNVLTDAAPVLRRLGIPATLFVATDFVFAGRMLWPDRMMAALALTREKRLAAEWPGGRREFDLSDDARKAAANHALRAVAKSLPQAERLALVDDIVARLGVEEARLPGAWDGFRPLEPAELALLPELGVTVGSHTCGHPIVSKLGAEDMKRELTVSKAMIEKATSQPCPEFAYPNGGPADFNEETRRQVMAAGYRCAVTTIKRRVVVGDDCFSLPRCTLTHNRISTAEFAAELSGFPGVLRELRSRALARPAVDPTLRGDT